MSGVGVENLSGIYKRLDVYSNSRDSQGLPESVELSDHIELPLGHQIYSTIIGRGNYYSISLGAEANSKSFLSGTEKRFKKQMSIRKLPWVVYGNANNGLFLKHEENNFFSYLIRISENSSDENALEICCGQEGLIPRNLTNEAEFRNHLEEMQKLANILFYPILKDGF